VPAASLHYKLRRSQKPGAQYGRQAETGTFHEIDEHGAKLLVNFDDYLDTGLFLDHRPLRRRIQQEASGKRFLNLFCYTGSATVHAVRGGASHTLSIDMSNTYLDWARRNLALNGVGAQAFDHPPRYWPDHALLRADCLKWLAAQEEHHARTRDRLQFDLILCDPPTFSHSKKMDGVLDTQRDHAALLRQCMALLAPGGALYFSTNRRGFKLDPALASEFAVKDLTAQTVNEDFKRPPPPHRCWQLTHSGAVP
jgi:23S rRNA (guanine2445-N2)-methyltransferase / 23S rRNA (guanine2069-N7)-methyltransferase